MSRGRKKRTLRDLSKDKTLPGDWEHIAKELLAASDRHAAIILRVHLEKELSDLIVSAFANRDNDTIDRLQEREGALSTFFSQIHLAYALGLIDSTLRDDLDLMRRIRNAFAHSRRPVNFETQEIKDAFLKVRCLNDSSHPVHKIYVGHNKAAKTVRRQFTRGAVCIMMFLAKAHLAQNSKALAASRRRARRLKQKKAKLEIQLAELSSSAATGRTQ